MPPKRPGGRVAAEWRQKGPLAAEWRQRLAAWRQWRHGGSLAAVAGGRKYAGGRVAAERPPWRQSGGSRGLLAAEWRHSGGRRRHTESLQAAGLQLASSLPALQIRAEGDKDRAGCPCMQMENA